MVTAPAGEIPDKIGLGTTMSDLIGQIVAQHYRIVEQLGQGGMATVYRAVDTRLDRDVAIKFIRRDEIGPAYLEQMLKRFEREAKSLARLSHPNIVKIHDYGDHEGAPYLVMEYLPGGTLKQRLGRAMPPVEAARLLIPIARALAYAHQQNLIHRDVKPANILITQSGDPMLTDFGIAKILQAESGLTALTASGAGLGTPDYMAPEQWTNEVVPQTDIYALGVVFYEMVTGRRPYTADTPAAVLMKQIQEPLPSPRSIVPDLPDAVEQVLYRALKRNPQDRYASMSAFAEALETSTQPRAKETASAPPVLRELTPRPLAPAPTPNPETRVKPPKDRPKQVPPAQRKIPLWWGAVAIVLFAVMAVAVIGLGALLYSSLTHTAPTLTASVPVAAPTPLMPTTAAVIQPAAATVTAPPATRFPPTLQPTAPPLGVGSSLVSAKDGMVQVFVPAGEFWMGAGNSLGNADERPQHQVNLGAFWIDRTEVTVAMFGQFATGTGYQTGAEKNNGGYLWNGHGWDLVPGLNWRHPLKADLAAVDNHPATHISWLDAGAYCAWVGRRLPTEAEWEKAARGPGQANYPWGNAAPTADVANFGNLIGDTTPVDQYPNGASPYGALDLAGNAFEWVADWYGQDYYAHSPAGNPTGPSSGQYRVLRGGSWELNASNVTVFAREVSPPEASNSNIGFRCASTP
jgi:eukaryotic-like serine/threonine-protein kinase